MGLITDVKCYFCNKKLIHRKDSIFGYPPTWRLPKVKRIGWICHSCYKKLWKWRKQGIKRRRVK